MNDSKCRVNSKKDRHADIGRGYIGCDGLKKFTQFCNSKNIPMILETPLDIDNHNNQLSIVKSWFDL